jgi:hypothetical protein
MLIGWWSSPLLPVPLLQFVLHFLKGDVAVVQQPSLYLVVEFDSKLPEVMMICDLFDLLDV